MIRLGVTLEPCDVQRHLRDQVLDPFEIALGQYVATAPCLSSAFYAALLLRYLQFQQPLNDLGVLICEVRRFADITIEVIELNLIHALILWIRRFVAGRPAVRAKQFPLALADSVRSREVEERIAIASLTLT